MFRPTVLRPLTRTPRLLRTYKDNAPNAPDPTKSSAMDKAVPNAGDSGSSSTGPHTDTGSRTQTRIHTVDKQHGLDVQSNTAQKGLADHAQAQKDAESMDKQTGGDGKKVSWDAEFPNKPKGPVIGMQDQVGGVEK